MAQSRRPAADLLKPPGEALYHADWHTLITGDGPRRLQWQPGLMVWRAEDTRIWAAETAGRLGWRYHGPADPPTPRPPPVKRRGPGRQSRAYRQSLMADGTKKTPPV